MDYFCYMSRDKIDALYRQLSADSDEWTETSSTENETKGELSADFSLAKVIQLFKGGITYGRKGVIHRERTMRKHYVDKLRAILVDLARERRIPSLRESLSSPPLNARYYHHVGKFTISEKLASGASSATVVSIQSVVNGYSVSLDCSLRNFSEGNEPDGTFHTHSSNHYFFGGGTLDFELVFVLLGQDEHRLFGTPLFLKLTDSPEYVL